jgi:hypothetical protein
MGFTHLQIEQNLWLGGYRPQIPILSALCPQLNLLNPPEQNSWYATALLLATSVKRRVEYAICQEDRSLHMTKSV